VQPVVVTINPKPTVTFVASKTKICLGESLTLTGAGATTYAWDNGVTNGTLFSPTTTKAYTVTGTDANGCINTALVNIPVHPLPIIAPISAVANKVMVGANMVINGSASNGLPNYNYSWVSSNPTIAIVNGSNSNPTLIGVKLGTVGINYYAVDANGCRSLTSNLFNVEIIPALMKFEIPNAFIPTDIYVDNRFLKASYNASVQKVISFKIYNRMGNMLKEWKDVHPSAISWDGKYKDVLQESDVYMWVAEISGLGTTTYSTSRGQFLLLK
jgi:hypothetical protein